MERTPIIQQLIDINRQNLLDYLVDGAGVPDWARRAIPDIGYLEAQAEWIRQMRDNPQAFMQDAQPQDAETLKSNAQERAWVNNLAGDTLGAFTIGVGNMVNNTLVGRLGGYGLGALGRIWEYVSPFSGEDKAAS